MDIGDELQKLEDSLKVINKEITKLSFQKISIIRKIDDLRYKLNNKKQSQAFVRYKAKTEQRRLE